MSYNSKLPADTTAPAEIRENLRALKEDKIVDAATAVVADSAAKLTTAKKISLEGDATGSTMFDGSADVSIAVDVLNADTSAQCSGNSATATKLETARNVNGVAFDGTKDITIKAEANGGNADTLNGQSANNIITICAPTGTVQFFATQNAPEGWLKADGSAVSRSSYANLFSAIDTLFGAGDGSSTFNLPDLRGEFVRGFDGGRGVDTGRTLGSNQADDFRSHNHRFFNEYNAPTTKIVAFTDESSENVNSGLVPGERAWTYISMENTGGLETRPRNVSLLACIKY
jgi:microcystin-dependent protein